MNENKTEEQPKVEIKPVHPDKIQATKTALKEIGIIHSDEVFAAIARVIDEKLISKFNTIGE